MKFEPTANLIYLACVMAESGIKTHPIVLTTRTSYVIPSSKYMLPTSWARYHLSQLINKVLSLPQPVPFDFLINGEILSGSLQEWCNEHAVGEVSSTVPFRPVLTTWYVLGRNVRDRIYRIGLTTRATFRPRNRRLDDEYIMSIQKVCVTS